jgi:hypothetical protein
MSDENTVQTLDLETGLKFFEDNHYFNPHLLDNNPDKARIRKHYVTDLLSRTSVYLVNTRGTPMETQRWIRSLVGVPQSP